MQMRTPAENYFGPEGFADLLEALTKFGQEKLGCTAISPPWLSVYVDGCEQRYHTDSWHGPWAFVLSLTGEVTVIRWCTLRPSDDHCTSFRSGSRIGIVPPEAPR